ncbi:hypothetical protein FOVG_18279 [Fusarium oxysporum f. sp. pisi HDV247]|uniref:Uncharacterized protein n=1 Tax=Fusarium oxysporum f. sp. pisi HDV247 TaxID=1080344 RepID=W9NCA0_FUSOX|nr:hypothetical protein FOVG_18279 [Fusarium oxysporum f. sp. pisi HDV247]
MNLIIVAEYTLRSTLLLIEMAVLLGVFLGITGAAGYFTWFIGQRLSPALSDEHLPDCQRALLYFGVPDFVKQMLVDTRKLLAATGLKSLPGQSDINKEDSVLEKAPNCGMV